MNVKRVNQEQFQNVNIAHAEHGMTDIVRCSFITKDMGSEPYHINRANMVNEVKLLIHKGEVKRVFCRYFSEGVCKSPHNTTEEKKCYLFKN